MGHFSPNAIIKLASGGFQPAVSLGHSLLLTGINTFSMWQTQETSCVAAETGD
jgi:hypoxanthine phosphoribosyltransferase